MWDSRDYGEQIRSPRKYPDAILAVSMPPFSQNRAPIPQWPTRTYCRTVDCPKAGSGRSALLAIVFCVDEFGC